MTRKSTTMATRMYFLTFVLTTVLIGGTSISAAASTSVSKVFQNDAQSMLPFQHMLVERQLYTGRVYIGGVNRLYQLSPDLDLQSRIETGPLDDSPDCPASRQSPCESKKTPTPNHNKALTVYAKQSKLIACGSVYQGSCRLHKLYNISDAEQHVPEAVVANDAGSSSVVFVAPGPPELQDSIYVASTYTNQGKFNDELPAVATRSLDATNFLKVAHRTINSETQMFVESSYRKQYRIDYVHGFSSGNYSYFVTRQPRYEKTQQSPYHSKLVRLCHGDQNYYSYTEVPLECIDERDQEYNLIQAAYVGRAGFDLARDLNISTEDDVLYAVFARSNDFATNGGGFGGGVGASTPTRQSALCVYSLKQIEEKFMDNIRLCANGSAPRGLSFFKQEKLCAKTAYASDYLACGNEVNYPLGGNMPIQRRAAYTNDQARLSSVAATTTHMYTVVFMGMDDGSLKKVVVEKAESGFEYDTIAVDPGRPILADMQFDMSGEYIYVLTGASVSKVKVQECEQKYQKCSQCLGAKDPYCGWCSAENKCSIQGSCNKQHWLPYKDAQCTTITKVTPDKLQVTTSAFVVLDIQNLQNIPQTGQLSCVYVLNGRKMVTGGSKTNENNSIRCAAPETYLRFIPSGRHATVASLSVQVDSGPELATTNFTFYDCSTYKSCSDCVSSDYPCDWCAETVTCTSNSEDTCRNQRIINGAQRPGPSIRKGPAYCPQIAPMDAANPTVYVPSGTTKALSVKVMNLLDFQTSFTCLFEIGPSVHKKAARRVEDRIECDPMDFTYFDSSPNDTAKFSVAWDDGKTLDNAKDIRVVMYRCEKLASNCGLCLYLDQQFACGWCEDSCTTEAKCKSGRWMDKSATCPGPKILSFSPQSGPLDGGTNVTIEGINLGRYFRDIENAVRINNVPCVPIETEYQPTTRIVCTTGPANHRKVQSGPIVVKLRDAIDYYALSDPGFDYVDPAITGFTPAKGPQSGGTIITIMGENLNAGSSVQAMVAGVPCEVIRRSKDKAFCRAGASTAMKKGEVAMTFDSASRTYVADQYSYEKDPSIATISTKKSTVSGGIRVRLDGDHFDLIQNARMYFTYLGQEYTAPCDVVTDDDSDGDQSIERDQSSGGGGGAHRRTVSNTPAYILCKSPRLPLSPTDSVYPLRNRPILVDFGFVLDGVQLLGVGVRNVSGGGGAAAQYSMGAFTDNKFMIFPDPSFGQFGKTSDSKPIRYFRGDFLSVDGESLDLAAEKEDVEVYIGDKPCIVWNLKGNELICKPPSEQPTRPSGATSNSNQFLSPSSSSSSSSLSSSGFSNDGLPEVSIRVGNANFTLGYLSYDDPTAGGAGGLPVETIGAVAGALGVFIVLIVILLVIFRRKATRQRRQMNTLKEHIDAIELKVASECKEAFAELQTDMTEMTNAIDNCLVHIPFLSYREYAVQVLFPNISNNPIDKRLEVDPHRRPMIDRGLRQFQTLIMNKPFLLTFIRTMEANKYFLSKDKVQVGSLLMVIMQDQMEYCTDILKALLSDLIGRTVERRYQPKVLFRRSECVAERMLATWFTFLMHRYLMECAGQPLFMLYWAIKQQTEKGPQDALLHEARYSLSEEKLVRQSVDFHPLTVYVNGPDMSTQDIPVRVLDCDTITQVKEKCLDAIYRTEPYSRRPSASDLELEWRTGVSGRLLLQDLDVTTKAEPGGWKKMNTLAHYKVPTNSSLALVPKHSSLYNLSLSSEKSSVLSLKNSPTLSRTLSPFSVANHHHQHHHNQKEPESGYKVYHLVKQSDDQHANTNGDRGTGKMVSEIYLTRLLTTKGTLQKFVEDLFEAIFSTAHRGSTLPICIKHMFDFMDQQAALYNITDPDVVHTWKSNSLPLRFWVNLIKNPHFVFDIARPTKIEGCLSVVAQTLMDSCSTQDPQLTKDSPSSKLLFARDIHTYREWVDRYYHDIQSIPSISDQDMNAFLADESRQHQGEFNVDPALHELYQYLDKYKEQIGAALEEDETCRRMKLSTKFEQMVQTMQMAENGTTATNTGTMMTTTGTLPAAYSGGIGGVGGPGMTSTLNSSTMSHQSQRHHGPPPYTHHHQLYNQSSLR